MMFSAAFLPAERRIRTRRLATPWGNITQTSDCTGRAHRLKDWRFPQFSGIALMGAVRKSAPPPQAAFRGP